MGVKDLWKVLGKAKRKMDTKQLQGKTLAVDLSCWVCRFSSVKGTVIILTKIVCSEHDIVLIQWKQVHISHFYLFSQLPEESLLSHSSSLLGWRQSHFYHRGCGFTDENQEHS